MGRGITDFWHTQMISELPQVIQDILFQIKRDVLLLIKLDLNQLVNLPAFSTGLG
jgi:hypothetical protein